LFEGYLTEHGFRLLSPKEITQQLTMNGFVTKQIKRDGINQRRILGLKQVEVTEVTEVTDISTQNIHEKRNESSVTSVTSVTHRGKPTNINDVKSKSPQETEVKTNETT